jgi:hypothetical protein
MGTAAREKQCILPVSAEVVEIRAHLSNVWAGSPGAVEYCISEPEMVWFDGVAYR